MKKITIRKGDRYGYVIIIKEIESIINKYGRKDRVFLCECDCGNIVDKILRTMREGKSKSCGCMQGNIIHGRSGMRIYNIWVGINERCNNKNIKQYKDYGGRGIKCEWSSFEKFYEDMYDDYLKHEEKHGEKQTTIDRTDVNGNYCKSNCCWATYKEQARNRRNNRVYKGKCFAEWEEKTGVNSIGDRLKSGWSLEEAVGTKEKIKWRRNTLLDKILIFYKEEDLYKYVLDNYLEIIEIKGEMVYVSDYETRENKLSLKLIKSK